VVASADRQWIAVREGLGSGSGRVLLWGVGAEGGSGALSRDEDARDLLNNTSDRIFGVDLNGNGSLGAARGAFATYFFGRDLRLQGSAAARSPAVQGVGFLPGSTSASAYADELIGAGTVRVVETVHYRAGAEIPVREQIAWPLRVGPPRPGLAQACPDRGGPPECVVATVYGVTWGAV
jgi:hypothetical protein